MLVLSIVVTIICVIKINSVLIKQSMNYENHLLYHIANDCFRRGTDILTDKVRRYVATSNPLHMEEYFNEAQHIRHRERAMEIIAPLQIDQSLKDALAKAFDASRNLMYTEYHAMHLIEEESRPEIQHEEVTGYELEPEELQATQAQRHAMAQELLWDESYIETKNNIYSYLDEGLSYASSSAMSRHSMLRNELLSMISITVASLTMMVIVIFGFVLNRRVQHEQIIEEQVKEIEKINIQLKEERDKSIEAEKAKSYFFSTVSHDIRTPLNAIIGFSEMLQLGIEDEKEKEKALDAIITSGNTLLQLINDVLDLSKLEAGKMEFHPVPTDVASLVSKVTNSFEAAASLTSVQLRTEVRKMPFLKLDPQRIRQILFNLIGNAVKFTTKGSITVSAAYENGTLTLSVSDTGCGISEEDIKKLMSPYVQLHGKDSTMGTGLGLAICKQLTTQMNGTLDIMSKVGEGTTFTLSVPDVPAFSDKESAEYFNESKPTPLAAHLDESFSKMNLLVVDDQKLNRSILRTMLARLGISNVLMAENGKEALDMMNKAEKVDIVLTDMFMPVMDGMELVKEIRKSPQFAKKLVYVVTADVEMQGKYKDMSFDGILIKPITIDRLTKLLLQGAPQA